MVGDCDNAHTCCLVSGMQGRCGSFRYELVDDQDTEGWIAGSGTLPVADARREDLVSSFALWSGRRWTG